MVFIDTGYIALQYNNLMPIIFNNTKITLYLCIVNALKSTKHIIQYKIFFHLSIINLEKNLFHIILFFVFIKIVNYICMILLLKMKSVTIIQLK